MNRILLVAVAGCGLLAGTASAQHQHPLAPAPMGMTAGPVQGQVSGDCGGGAGCGEAVASAPATAGYARHDSRYGWNPLFRKLAFWKRDNSCGTCGGGRLFSRLRGLCSGGGCGGGAGGFGGQGGPAFNPYPNGVPGTLVFPNHQFTRSPRDFFMTDSR